MTRRTPQPGDSYYFRGLEWRVSSVVYGWVAVRVRKNGSRFFNLPLMHLETFHDRIARETWGQA